MNRALSIAILLVLAVGCSGSPSTSETHAADKSTYPADKGKASDTAAAKNSGATTANTHPSGTAQPPGNADKNMPSGMAATKPAALPPNVAKAPDNTGVNQRDKSGDTLTPTDQSETEADRDLTQRVRQAIVADETLSIDAKNIKIISQSGTVTLRGPVADLAEKTNIESKVKALTGVQRVDDQLDIKHP